MVNYKQVIVSKNIRICLQSVCLNCCWLMLESSHHIGMVCADMPDINPVLIHQCFHSSFLCHSGNYNNINMHHLCSLIQKTIATTLYEIPLVVPTHLDVQMFDCPFVCQCH